MSKWSALFVRLLKTRGVDENFLTPKYEDLSDPFLLPDMRKAVERILTAGKNNEKVIIYGDYDVDGVTASVVMDAALRFAGVKSIDVLLPDRFIDGYGMGEKIIDEAASRNASLVVTVDCGSGSSEVIDRLNEEGIDCIVTDHHEIPNVPEGAVAVVNPKRDNATNGNGSLAGVGVAFKVAQAVNQEVNGGKVCDGQEKWLLDLVAIGTVCDSMELTGENRILVKYGMKVLGKTRRIGLIELMKLADVKAINTKAIGFQIGPRLNASGRMHTADVALKMLMADARLEAFGLAKKLDEFNKIRKKTQQEAISEVEKEGVGDEPVIVVKAKCHEGVIGIVSGRLTERYRKPSFVLTEVEEGLLKGSGRSFGDFSLADCIMDCQKLLVKGGGHNFACGITIANSNFDKFKYEVNNFYKKLGLKNQEKFLVVKEDLCVNKINELDEQFCKELEMLEPFGEGNREPVFMLQGVIILSKAKMGVAENHLRLSVRGEDGKTLKLIAFYAREEWFDLEEGERANIKINLEMNEWNGVKSVQGRILGVERMGMM